ncbi:SDR family NAD(P)-dependent oxidoreductase [Croceitalea sp. P059]|uniref:SDR family NAD(P)-dependent oxidoreductase n=1 Tax=Croceitalea sp. P059 TaxID=3075601 RepID=UPI002887A48D|nr:SDR family NAD(P)-dependent oxidoreductase [Croceitalea sp. P059]MDT0539468.1 SDR family NAD(P)-dependent oxidoreductase [Croceitalea sp. P059]
MKVFHERLFPIGLVFFIDVLLTAMSFVLSYALCSFILPDISSHTMLVQLPIVVAITSMIFLFIGIYKGIVKYDRIREVYSIFNAICLANILTIVLVVINGKLVLENDLMVPLSIIIVHSVLSFSALVASRFLYKNIKRRISSKFRPQIKVVLITDQEYDNNFLANVSGKFEDQNRNLLKIFTSVNGDKNLKQLSDYVEEKQIAELFMLNRNSNSDSYFETLNEIYSLGIPIKSINDLDEFEIAELNYETIFPNQIQNNLFNQSDLARLENKTIFITGAGGSIGSEFAKRLYRLNINARVVLIDNSESSLNHISGFLSNSSSLEIIPKLLDIKDKKLMKNLFDDFKPSIVIHTAGNTFLEFLDENQNKTIQQNLTSTKLIADLAKEFKVEKFVFCSSNKAFKPTTTLEVSKRLAELYLESLNEKSSKTDFISLRLNKVYDTKNSEVNYIKGQLSLNRPINLKFIYKEEVFTNLKDVVSTILFLTVNQDEFKKGTFSTSIGTKIDSELLIQIINLIEGPEGNILNEGSFKNDFIEENIFENYKSLKKYSKAEEFLKLENEYKKLSKDKIQQKVEHICLNVLFDDNDSEPIFDLIEDFGLGKWKREYNRYLDKGKKEKIIKLQTN